MIECFGHTRVAAPYMTAPFMLPSALPTAAAPAISHFRGSIVRPTQLLCTFRPRCHHRGRNTHYQAGATPYLGRTCTGWIAAASPGAPEVWVRPPSGVWRGIPGGGRMSPRGDSVFECAADMSSGCIRRAAGPSPACGEYASGTSDARLFSHPNIMLRCASRSPFCCRREGRGRRLAQYRAGTAERP